MQFKADFTSSLFTPDRLLADSRRVRLEKRALASGTIARGDIVGRVAGTATATAVPGNTGNGTLGAVTVGARVRIGTYRLRCEQVAGATRFHLEDAEGRLVQVATVGVPTVGALNFTITAGGTPFAIGDAFTVDVADSGNVALVSPVAAPGASIAWGIAATDADASDAPAELLVYSGGGQFNVREVTVGAGALLAVAEQELRARDIVLVGSMPS